MRMVIVEVLKVNNKSSKLIIRMTGCVIYWTHNVLLCKESRNYLSKKRSDVIISKSKVLTGKKNLWPMLPYKGTNSIYLRCHKGQCPS